MVLHLSCGQPPHPWDSKAASEVMDTLKGAALAFILCIGPCYAADKIALICSDAKGKDDFSLSIPASI
jgi:hypothetical protein